MVFDHIDAKISSGEAGGVCDVGDVQMDEYLGCGLHVFANACFLPGVQLWQSVRNGIAWSHRGDPLIIVSTVDERGKHTTNDGC